MTTRSTAQKGSGLARARIEAHKALDVLWRFGAVTRNEAYAWLAGEMGLRSADCHIGMFDEEQCRLVVAICDNRGTILGANAQKGRQSD